MFYLWNIMTSQLVILITTLSYNVGLPESKELNHPVDWRPVGEAELREWTLDIYHIVTSLISIKIKNRFTRHLEFLKIKS